MPLNPPVDLEKAAPEKLLGKAVRMATLTVNETRLEIFGIRPIPAFCAAFNVSFFSISALDKSPFSPALRTTTGFSNAP